MNYYRPLKPEKKKRNVVKCFFSSGVMVITNYNNCKPKLVYFHYKIVHS